MDQSHANCSLNSKWIPPRRQIEISSAYKIDSTYGYRTMGRRIKTYRQFQSYPAEYRTTFAWLAILPHIVIITISYLLLRHRNPYRKTFIFYYILNFIWVLVFVGGWFSIQLYQHLGLAALAMYIGTPAMLCVILYQWIQEW